jgi:Esterase-like activity of phytase
LTGFDEPGYPFIVSANRKDGTPIPFSALSGLAGCGSLPKKGSDQNCSPSVLYTLEDNAYKKNRILAIDTKFNPPAVTAEQRITDSDGVFAAALKAAGFESFIEKLINSGDANVNIDTEGISLSTKGGFWIVHEGDGTFNDKDRPIKSPNVLFKISNKAVIEQAIFLPDGLNKVQSRFGFEGVAEYGDEIVVAFQRRWNGEPHPRMGLYNPSTKSWRFVYYPLDKVESQNKDSWVGVSDISYMGSDKLYVLERDNQAGPDAAIKRIYSIDLSSVSTPLSVLKKTLVADLLDTLSNATNGPVIEKIEGMALDGFGNLWVNTDNDGLDDNSGESLLIKVQL